MKAIAQHSSRADCTGTAAVRLRVDPPGLRDDLLEFLRASSCLALKHGADEIEAHLLNSVSDRQDRNVIVACVDAWKTRHTGVSVERLAG